MSIRPGIHQNEDCSIFRKVVISMYWWNIDKKNIYGACVFTVVLLTLNLDLFRTETSLFLYFFNKFPNRARRQRHRQLETSIARFDLPRLVETCLAKPSTAQMFENQHCSFGLVETCLTKPAVAEMLGNQECSYWLAWTCHALPRWASSIPDA